MLALISITRARVHYATSSGGNSEGFSVRIPFIELHIGVGRKGDHRRKAGAAFRAEPNVTGVLAAPILGPYGRNQLSIALNTTHHVNLPSSMRRRRPRKA